ncbi:MAG: DUF2793 domain-containing protein [Hyphomonas sp.]
MDFSQNLGLPYLQASQAQKHITLNESLERLDAAIQLCVKSRQTDLAALAPGEPAEGDRYIVPSGATGAWDGHDGEIAGLYAGGWIYLVPRQGWQAWVEDEGARYTFIGQAWTNSLSGAADTESLGVNMSANTTRRLSVSSEQSMFNHAGTDHRLTINRNAATDVASVMFQEGFSGRGELSLTSGGALELRTSVDGAAWQTRLSLPLARSYVVAPALRSGTVQIPDGGVATIDPPESGGFVLVTVIDENYPQGHHSGILVYDVGASPALVTLAIGTGISNEGVQSPASLVGQASRSNIAVDTTGIHIRNRTGGLRVYSFTLIC